MEEAPLASYPGSLPEEAWKSPYHRSTTLSTGEPFITQSSKVSSWTWSPPPPLAPDLLWDPWIPVHCYEGGEEVLIFVHNNRIVLLLHLTKCFPARCCNSSPGQSLGLGFITFPMESARD